MLKININTKSFHLKTLNLAILNILFFFFKKFKTLHFTCLRKSIKKLEIITILKAPKINKSARNQIGKYTYKTNIQIKFLLKKGRQYEIIMYYIINLILCRINIMYVSLNIKKYFLISL